MRFLASLIALIFLSGNLSAESGEAKQVMGDCGDHYFRVHFTANLESKKAILYYSGDSGEDKEFTGTLKINKGGTSFHIDFNNPEKGYLAIDGTDHYHNIYWGEILRSENPKNSMGLGLCSVTWSQE